MLSSLLRCLAAASVLLVSAHAQAPPVTKDTTAATAATSVDDGPPGVVPVEKGFNLSLNTTSQHDSSNGWASLLEPDAAYRFNKNFSADVTAPMYDYIVVEVTAAGSKANATGYATKHFVFGDTALNGHFQASPSLFDYELTATLGLPSGNTTYGLGTGQVSYEFNNTFQHSFGIFTPTIALGIGDSSSLAETRIRKAYTTVGTEAIFQAGTSVWLPHNLDFSAAAYENLPVAPQTLYSTTGRGKKKVTTAIGKSQAEDNGFETSLDIPFTTHVTLSGFYNRSLRSHIDTAGFSLLFLLKAHPKNSTH